MRILKSLLAFTLVLTAAGLMAQSVYTDDFETYTTGSGIAEQDDTDTWTTWSNSPGGSEDPVVTDEAAFGGSQALMVSGTNDGVLLLNDLIENRYRVEFYLMVPDGFIGYYNILQDFAGSGSTWGMQVYFTNGTGTIDGDGAGAATFSYTPGEWMKIQHFVDLDNDWIDIYIDDELIHAYQWSAGTFGTGINKLDAFNFYAWNDDGNGTPKYFMDNYIIEQVATPEPPSNLTATVDGNNVTLQWDAPAGDNTPENYSIIRNGQVIASADGAETSYTDSTVYPSTHSYEIKAFYGTSVGYSPSVGPAEALVEGGVARDVTLMEIFTGTWCQYCPAVAVAADSLSAYHDNVAILEYHSGDTYDIAPSQIRDGYYAIAGYPTTLLGGEVIIGGGGSSSEYAGPLATMENEHANRINKQAVVDLDIDIEWLDSVSYQLDITAEEVYEYFGDNLVMHIALTESHIQEAWQDLDNLQFVVRNMFPDGNGTAIDFSTDPVQTITEQVVIDTLINDKWNCEIVVFIQDNDTKEVVQAQKIVLEPGVGIGNKVAKANARIYPNPATDLVHIYSDTNAKSFTLMNLAGQVINMKQISGTHNTISVNDLPKGVYLLQINTSKGSTTQKIVKN